MCLYKPLNNYLFYLFHQADGSFVRTSYENTEHIDRRFLEQTDDAASKFVLWANYYENMSMQYTAIFHGGKNEKFWIKKMIIFLFLLKT